jgi:hypothetical protein
MADPFTAFDGGWHDPDAPAELHPRLRGEEGVAIAGWLAERGVTANETADVAAVLEAYASGWAADVEPALLIQILRGALERPGTLGSPALATLLQAALARVSNAAELHALIAFLRRTALVLTLRAGSGPLPLHYA